MMTQHMMKITVDMSTLVPMVAQPHSPDNVVRCKRIRRYEDQSR